MKWFRRRDEVLDQMNVPRALKPTKRSLHCIRLGSCCFLFLFCSVVYLSSRIIIGFYLFLNSYIVGLGATARSLLTLYNAKISATM
jgi:hypothetical protein